MLIDMVEAVAQIRWNRGDRVAVEDGYLLAVVGCDSRTAEVATARTAVRTHLIGLSSIEGDGEGLSGRFASQGIHRWCDVDFGVVFGGNNEEGTSLVVGLVLAGAE